eukprot:3896211-Rhodomonas_salina.1
MLARKRRHVIAIDQGHLPSQPRHCHMIAEPVSPSLPDSSSAHASAIRIFPAQPSDQGLEAMRHATMTTEDCEMLERERGTMIMT